MRTVLLLCLLCGPRALAERLLVCGYELQTTRAGVETDPGDPLGAASIVTSPVHGGAAAGQAVAVSGVRSSFRHYFLSATPAFYARVYVRLEQPVNAQTMFLLLRRSSAVPAIAWLTLNPQGQVGARVWVTDYPTNVTLTLGQWHRFDLFVDERGASGTHVVQLAIDGQTFLLVQGLSLSHVVDQLEVGLNVNAELAGAGTMYFDDVAVNGTAGSDENGFPLPGQVFLMSPDGPASAPTWTPGDGGLASTQNWGAVSELPPDDGVTVLESRTNARASDEFTVSAPPPLPGPAALVAVGLRFSGDGTTNRSVGVSMRVGDAGTLLQSAGGSAAITTFRSNRDDGYLNPPLVTSRTPEGLPWNDAALADLRIGLQDADSTARPLMVTNVWAFVEYPVNGEPPPPLPGSGPPDAGVDAGVDAGSPADAGTADAGGTFDAGAEDGGLETPDAGSGDDGGRPPDAGTTQQSDGGVTEPGDASSGSDGGRGPARYAVGCACGVEGGWSWLVLAALLARRP